jgi:prepilin-type N-terminal cleavage/methylation domain-containing protein
MVWQRWQKGLTMVEVVAAMVIFCSAAAVLFSWIGQVAQRVGAFQEEQRVLFAQMRGIEYAKTINPMARPQGSQMFADGVRLQWTAKQ